MKINWISITQAPPTRRPLLFCGYSGYIAPNERMVVSGYYDPGYRPFSPYLDSQSVCLTDCGLKPTHWAYLNAGDFPESPVE